ncbi:50S ribosomal protein L32e [Candidatus Pacearchaeota archaeon CG10_big_fil_rev_8_21_14_0_10_35_219]|nr:MAG: 50S ribosomal protein L32e [Candidatus Pacearchaeota archaeon CG10_big_fil_rev_8_21_14_0_10_35_219]PIZ80196.1 MAG: 50S ribosomal protein L32e [Candidatus Pacearchaeota archaeon CG_4_10_14_0_2_um_filter_35_33]PJA69539.1 MAG: 50S ribosomal protein L32e [Candidatus Pacearchaeota archaeon CG_4_9_14_3_um_filter_35_19]
MKKFIRRDSGRFSKLGKKRKKLQKWRGAKGRDNKIREKRKGYPKAPVIGYKKSSKNQGKIKGLIPVHVSNVKDLEKVGKKNIIIVGKIGARKKMELLKKIDERKLEMYNVSGGKK